MFVSDRAHLVFPFHQALDGLLEGKRKSAIGTTSKGIGPAYCAKAERTGVRAGDMLDLANFAELVDTAVRRAADAGAPTPDPAAFVARQVALAKAMAPLVVDGVQFLHEAMDNGKWVLAEGANAAMLDLDFGTYPMVTSSSTTVGGVCTGLGVPPSAVHSVIGVVKAYTTRVGGGPFPSELTDARGGGLRALGAPESDIGLFLQQVGQEVGVTTGRLRRCGWLDAVVVGYIQRLNGYSHLCLTKVSGPKQMILPPTNKKYCKWPVCVMMMSSWMFWTACRT